MQMTYVQTQIEEAIKQHVLKRVNLEPGEELDIDLRATRGPEGYTCVIFVTGEPTPTNPLDITGKVAAARNRTNNTVGGETASYASTNAQAGEEATTEPEADAPADDAPAAEEASETASEDSAEEQPTKPKKRSIFENLQKPQNPPREKPETGEQANDTDEEAAA